MSESRIIDKIWYTRGPGPTPLGLAAQLGWFLEEFRDGGVGVYTLQDAQHKELRSAHYDHRLAHSFRQGGSGPAIWARASGRDTRIIGLNCVDEFQAIITLPERRITSLKQLRGRRLALPKRDLSFDLGRAAALRGFLTALDFAGLSEADVTFVDVWESSPNLVLEGAAQRGRFAGSGDVVQALLDGQVDVIFVRGAQGVQVLFDLQARLLLDLRSHPDPLLRANNGNPRPITVDADLLARRPDIVVRFLSRIAAVGPWASLHPVETIRYLAKETGTLERHVRIGYGASLHNQQYTDLDERSVAALESYKDFLFARGFIPRDFDVKAWIDTEPLGHINGTGRVSFA
ncbi:ABC transporter, substrate-binding protein, aliphatic sulfonates family [compost metagenome]